MMARAASALAAAHRAGIIHRDVKPDNLFLVGERGAPYTLKVVDFGMAKLSEASSLSVAGMALGTLQYIAPEQALADPVDGRTDVYGLGVVLYRMLTGKMPFEANDDATLVAHHLFTPAPLPSLVKPGIDPRLEAVILTAMRKRPENRYPSMTAVEEDLERILGQRDGAVVPAPIRHEPDHYEAVNPSARSAADVLRTSRRARDRAGRHIHVTSGRPAPLRSARRAAKARGVDARRSRPRRGRPARDRGRDPLPRGGPAGARPERRHRAPARGAEGALPRRGDGGRLEAGGRGGARGILRAEPGALGGRRGDPLRARVPARA